MICKSCKSCTKTSAVCAHEPLWFVHKRRPIVSGSRRKVIPPGHCWRPAVGKSRALLLSNVNLFLFVHVTEEVYQPTNKGYGCQPECDPSRRMAAGWVRIGYKSIKIIDCTDGGAYAHHYRKNVFQAFHFEPPARCKIMKVMEKAESIALLMAAC